ncbi:MAG: hypothetical protein ACK4TB_03410 [Gemmobacter sp.]
MSLTRRIARLEAARRARPDPDADQAFTEAVRFLDRLAARKAAGDAAADGELRAFIEAAGCDAALGYRGMKGG